jgi:integrase/recombinase XerC
MFARNVSVLQIQENLGHEQLVTTQIYAHLLPREIPRQTAAV